MASSSNADRSRAGSRGVRPSRQRGALVAIALGAGTGPFTAVAQSSAAPACSYDTCALRREGVFFSQRVLAGAQGRVVARGGFSGFRLDSALAGSERALAEVRRHRREARLGSALSLAGAVLGGIGIIEGVRLDGATTHGAALTVAGALVSGVGAWRLQISDRALNRAIWWYNRDLPR